MKSQFQAKLPANSRPQFHISRVVGNVGVPGGERGNIQTGGGDRVSTISQPGYSTSVALATGPTDKEEEVDLHAAFIQSPMSSVSCSIGTVAQKSKQNKRNECTYIHLPQLDPSYVTTAYRNLCVLFTQFCLFCKCGSEGGTQAKGI